MLNSNNHRQTLLMTLGTLGNSLLGLLFYILVARILGPATYGQFAYLLGLGLILAEFANWGFDAGIIKFGSSGGLAKAMAAALFPRALLFSLSLIIAIYFQILTGHFYLLSWLTGISLSLLALGTQAFLAKEKYPLFVFVNITGNMVRLIVTFLLVISQNLTPELAIITFSLANLLSGLAAVIILRKTEKILFDFANYIHSVKEIFSFSKWLGGSFALASLSSKIDVPIIYSLSGSLDAGLYSGAQKLASVFPQLTVALESVFSPKFSKKVAFRQNFRDYLLLSLGLSIIIIIGLPFYGNLITLVLGNKYLSAIPVFQVFILGLVPFFLVGPFTGSVLYRFGRSDLHLAASTVQLLTSLFLYFILVPSWGAMGAAWTYALTNFLVLVIYISLTILCVRQK